MSLEKLKRRIREYSYRENHEEMFTLASGKKSPYYFDLKQTLLEPEFLELAAKEMGALMKRTLGGLPEGLSGLTMGADPLVYAIAVGAIGEGRRVYPLPVRKKTKGHGSQKRVEGLVDEARRGVVVLVDDVITTGGSTLQAWEALQEVGIEVKDAFCVLDRLEGGGEAMLEKGLRLHHLFTRKDFSEK